MNELIAAFGQVAVASVADAVDKVCGRRGYLDSVIKPRINDQRICGPAATVLEAATEVEDLTTGLSQKIWQKINVTQSMNDRPTPA